jgi:probable rRNA maturation factor
VLLTTDAVIRHLNHKYRGLDRATDVLSFAQEAQSAVLMGQRLPLGDIVISVEAAQRGAQRFHVPVETEMRRLTTHGLLHLQGWDHGTPTERARMVGLQEKLLREVSRVAAR